MSRIKMAILTAGNIAGVMADTIRHMDSVEMYAVGARDLGKATEFADTYGFQKAYGSYEELVADEEVQLVYVASPHSHHFEHVKLCLNHGKHVLCEKAFTTNAKQAAELFALAKEKKLLLTEAMWVQYMPMKQTLQEIIASGIVGELSTVTANLYYVIDEVKRILDPALAGGALLDVGVYTLTFASIVFGNEIERIQATSLMTQTGVDAQTNVVLCYKDGKMAVLNSGIMSISDRAGIIYGRKGYIVVENVNNFEQISVYNLDRELVQSVQCPKQISGYEYEVQACVEAIENGWIEHPNMPHAQTITIMEWMDTVREQIELEYPCV